VTRSWRSPGERPASLPCVAAKDSYGAILRVQNHFTRISRADFSKYFSRENA
jgi:hypothetical protein